MTDLARWSLKVPQSLDRDLRTFLAERGGRKGDLSRWVADAVGRELLRQTMEETAARNADLSEEEVMQLVNEEIAAYRAERGSDWRKWCE